MRRTLNIIAGAVAFLVGFGLTVTIAQEAAGSLASAPVATAAPSVTIPVGAWTGGILDWLAEIMLGAAGLFIAFLSRNLPASVVGLVSMLVTEQTLKRAIDWAFAQVKTATKGKEVTIPTANALLDAAAEYVVANAPSLAGKLGETLRPKLVARLSAEGVMPAESTATADLRAPLPLPVTK